MKPGMDFKLRWLVLLFVFILQHDLHAQFEISAEIRPQLEYRQGYGILPPYGATPAIFMSQRSRVSFKYFFHRIKYNFAIQDIRIWGDENLYSSTGIFGDNVSLDLKEAWIQFSFKTYSSIKVGRQILKYEDERLISTRDWNQNGISYDAILYQYQDHKWRIDCGFSLNNEEENQIGNLYSTEKLKTLNFLYIKNQFFPNFYISLLSIGSGFTTNDTSEVIYMRGTYGIYTSYKYNKFILASSVFYQNGKNRMGKDVSAYFFSIDVGVSFKKFTSAGGIHYLSGQDGTKNDANYQAQDHLFDILYGARHRYFGLMDNFNNIPKSTNNGGLVYFFCRFDFEYFGENFFRIDYHWFYLQKRVFDSRYSEERNIYLPKRLGNELDIVVNQNLYSGIDLKFGYSIMFPTSTREILSGIEPGKSEISHWAWIMLTFFNTIFSSNEKQ